MAGPGWRQSGSRHGEREVQAVDTVSIIAIVVEAVRDGDRGDPADGVQ